MTHADLKDLVPLYALDAVSPQDEQELVAHLRVCQECAALLDEHRKTAGMLGLAAGSQPVPPGLKDRVMGQAAASSRPQASQAPRPAQPILRMPALRWVGLAGAFLLALVVAGGLVLQIGQRNGRISEQEAIIAAQREALDLISSPSAIVLPMTPTEAAGAVRGQAFVSDADGRAAVVVSGLDDPGAEVYTLWLIAEGEPRPVSDFLPQDGLALIAVNDPVRSDSTLAVTREPQRGNQSPQGPVLVVAHRG